MTPNADVTGLRRLTAKARGHVSGRVDIDFCKYIKDKMNWINVKERVPDDRREVLAWGLYSIHGIDTKSCFLGITRFNNSKNGGRWDAEKTGSLSSAIVTHWCEIEGPNN